MHPMPHCHNKVADIKTCGGALGMMEAEGIPLLFSVSNFVLEKKVRCHKKAILERRLMNCGT